jgi:hypothetical protein
MREQEIIANSGILPEHFVNNAKRIDYMKKNHSHYRGSDEFDNGFRNAPSYNLEDDDEFE